MSATFVIWKKIFFKNASVLLDHFFKKSCRFSNAISDM